MIAPPAAERLREAPVAPWPAAGSNASGSDAAVSQTSDRPASVRWSSCANAATAALEAPRSTSTVHPAARALCSAVERSDDACRRELAPLGTCTAACRRRTATTAGIIRDGAGMSLTPALAKGEGGGQRSSRRAPRLETPRLSSTPTRAPPGERARTGSVPAGANRRRRRGRARRRHGALRPRLRVPHGTGTHRSPGRCRRGRARPRWGGDRWRRSGASGGALFISTGFGRTA